MRCFLRGDLLVAAATGQSRHRGTAARAREDNPEPANNSGCREIMGIKIYSNNSNVLKHTG